MGDETKIGGWTPGPWATLDRFPCCIAAAADAAKSPGASIDAGYDRTHFAVLIAEARSRHPDDHPHKIPEDQARANARLMAAAPDLYAALQSLANAIMEGDDQSAFQIAKNAGAAALLKAQGQS
jgi:hypothetical protein